MSTRLTLSLSIHSKRFQCYNRLPSRSEVGVAGLRPWLGEVVVGPEEVGQDWCQFKSPKVEVLFEGHKEG